MTRRALSIGINYAGSPYALGGCLNDARNWNGYLQSQGAQTTLLLEQEATATRIRTALRDLLASLRPGDVGIVTYSGHGTWLPDRNGDECDGRDEALCPVDSGTDGQNLIVDDELRQLFTSRDPASRVVFITDCCHSGTMFRFLASGDGPQRIRYLPPATLIRDPRLLERVQRLGPAGPPCSEAPLPGVIHFSGCRDHEYSYDAVIGGQACGAFSEAALGVLATIGSAGVPPTYLAIYQRIHQRLPRADYPQTPRLNACTADRQQMWLT